MTQVEATRVAPQPPDDSGDDDDDDNSDDDDDVDDDDDDDDDGYDDGDVDGNDDESLIMTRWQWRQCSHRDLSRPLSQSSSARSKGIFHSE